MSNDGKSTFEQLKGEMRDTIQSSRLSDDEMEDIDIDEITENEDEDENEDLSYIDKEVSAIDIEDDEIIPMVNNHAISTVVLDAIEDIFTESEIKSINSEMTKLDLEIASIAAVALKVDDFASGRDMLEHALENSKHNILGTEKAITRIILEAEVKLLDNEDNGRSLDDIFQDKKNIEESLGKVSLFSNGEQQRLDDMELSIGSPLISTVSFFTPSDIRNKMRISPSLFSPILEIYQEVFDDDDDFRDIMTPYINYPIYSDDILKDF